MHIDAPCKAILGISHLQAKIFPDSGIRISLGEANFAKPANAPYHDTITRHRL